ncbi:putative protein phosphatase 2C [Acanthamoeba castellanii mimivirus]|nr:putative protein phosphatase 2C [Acanthamoeba polyphaga mimivirus]AEQ60494.1 Serine/Threonine protein phosphatase [Acanthamoeba castellanii mamavirus]AHA45559.1 putative protein phosphatase 2C [Hirudovirus strain Sangsue]AHJ40032.1 protein phosphatase 2c [Samba virus]ALR83887.1 serine/threonine protein phosphatase [Niemeyer virus]AMZ02754.1 putative protein phosphatase 2C [Mimivirus Bombay]EJN40755.1 serine/threonine protein phosphatase [Acanthamoeba polyphaga lentillevirus]BAV61405.1 put
MPRKITSYKTSLQGLREENEDVELMNLNLLLTGKPNNPKYAPIDLFIVCDGHGGKEVAEYVAPRLNRYIMNNNNTFPLHRQHVAKIYDAIQNELIGKGIARTCGCTALVIIRYMNESKRENIQVINIGDCRAVLCKNGLAIPLNKDHKPIWPDEKRRIDRVNEKYETNEKIHFDAGDWRIGDLSVSRSFGDLDNTPYVTHVPDLFDYQLQSDDEFIIMACDGVWDVLENHEAINFVRDHRNDNHTEFYSIPGKYPNREAFESDNISRKLASYAIARGSTDNVSVIIIFFSKE